MGDYYYYGKKSGQIPAFGDWETANEMPITQYFESARQAGVLRYSSSSSAETEIPSYNPHADLYPIRVTKHSRNLPHPKKGTRRETWGPRSKEQRKQGRVCDVTDPPNKSVVSVSKKLNNFPSSSTLSNGAVPRPSNPKPVDEDLYKIPPELIRSSKRKKRMPGFFACLAPCTS